MSDKPPETFGARFGQAFDGSYTGAVFVISVAAQLAGMHPQTLRQYDRLGLVQPERTAGGGRRYSPRDVVMLREIVRLSQEEGVNLAGIRRIMDLEHELEGLRQEVASLHEALQRIQRREVSTALVVWRPPSQ